ncbi:tyrosine-type recombinase/integrase [Lacrimispora indolis]|uniref:tyrosine-type recombinase/integrase n=1 Tax=Lacrimispora indolis TaxID=69825 RepID=UPI000462D1CF
MNAQLQYELPVFLLLSIEYRSSHKLRFSIASNMYKNGVEDTELQKLLDHTSLNMTHHYLRSITPQEETVAKMRVLQKASLKKQTSS